MSLSDLVASSANALAMRSESASWTYHELAIGAETLGNAIAARRTDVRRPIAHVFDLVPEAVVAALAVARAGSTLAPAHPEWKTPERERFDQALCPEIVLSSDDRSWLEDGWDTERLLLPGFGPIAVSKRSVAADEPGLEAPPGTDVVLSTSGSGGAPKFVGHSWAALIANAQAANERLDFGSDSTWLSTLAWAHVGGLAVIPRAAAAGAVLAFGGPRFDASDALEQLRAHRVTHVSLVPAMAHRLIERAEPPPATLQVALVGGAAMPPAVTARAIAESWPISLTYGMTEAGSQVATAPPEQARALPSCVGLPLSSAEVRIEAPDEEGMGEILIRGSSLFLGYLGESPRDPEAWFATGDLGVLDAEGHLRVTGRRSTRIISGGTNVDPLEVEAQIAEHPDVSDVCVVGLPDPVWGEIVTCVVATQREDLAGDLDAWTKERLSGARAPRRWKMVDALPRTATGKVDRAGVRALVTTEP